LQKHYLQSALHVWMCLFSAAACPGPGHVAICAAPGLVCTVREQPELQMFISVQYTSFEFYLELSVNKIYSLPLDGGYISVKNYQSQYDIFLKNILKIIRVHHYRFSYFFVRFSVYQVWFKKEMKTLSEYTYCSVGSKSRGTICWGIIFPVPSQFSSGPSSRACRPSAALCFRGPRRGCRRAGCPRQAPPCMKRGFGRPPLGGPLLHLYVTCIRLLMCFT